MEEGKGEKQTRLAGDDDSALAQTLVDEELEVETEEETTRIERNIRDAGTSSSTTRIDRDGPKSRMTMGASWHGYYIPINVYV